MATPDPLIGVDRLATMLTDAPPVILDVRWQLGGPPGEPAFYAGHIPGAVYVDLEAELAAAPGAGGRHPLPGAGPFGAAMRAKGVRSDRPVVAYDAGGPSLAAARAWWLLRYFGHPDVAVLDGGLAAWQAAGQPLTGERPAVEPGDFDAVPGAMAVLDAAGAARVASEGVLLDARAPERFRGEVEPLDPVAGHIPGARNLPAGAHLAPDGRLLDAAGQRSALAELASEPAAEVGAYCGSGITAAHTVLAAQRAGVAVALYPGSWSEWITDPDRPVATGPD